METKLKFRVKHSLPGRLRVELPSLTSHKKLIQCMKLYLSDGRGVTRVTTNHYSGSITILYDAKITGEEPLFHMLNNVTLEELVQLKDDFFKSIEEGGKKSELPKSGKGQGICNSAAKIFRGIGMAGIFVPLLPATPLLLLAAYCQKKADGNTT